MESKAFDTCMSRVWDNEGVKIGEDGIVLKDGAYSADGTHTRFGIAWEYNKEILRHLCGITSGEQMSTLTLDEAEQIYKLKYWNKCGAEKASLLSVNLAYQLFDSAVNQGVSASVKILQDVLKSCGADIQVDGKFGPKTEGSLFDTVGGFPHKILLEFFKCRRRQEYYETLFDRCRRTPDRRRSAP